MKTFSITDVGMVRQVNQDYVYTTCLLYTSDAADE